MKTYLKPIQPKARLGRSWKIWTMDAETKDGLKREQLFCMSFCRRRYTKLEVSTFHDYSEIYDFLESLAASKQKHLIYVHNLEFDVAFIQQIDLLHNRFDSSKRIAAGADCLQYKYAKNVVFRDSAQFLQSEQEVAEKDYDCPAEFRKIDVKDLFKKNFAIWSDSDKARMIAHNQNDVKALLSVLEVFRREMFAITQQDIVSSVSIASYALRTFRTTLPEWIQNNNVAFNYETKSYEATQYMNLVRASYRGGRTEVFSQANRNEPTHYIDRNSSFPAEMFARTFPCGDCEKFEGRTMDEYRQMFASQYEGFVSCTVDSPQQHIPYLLVKHQNKLIAGVGVFDCTITLFELRECLKRGYDVLSINWVLLYKEARPIFKTFIEKLYNVKLDAEKQKKKGKRQCAKILMNSSYGKFAQRTLYKRRRYRQCDISEGGVFKQFKLREHTIQMQESVDISESIKTFLLPELSSYVTAYARHALYEMIEASNFTCKYCDTDSVVIPVSAMNLQIESMIGLALGQWKIEEPFMQEFYPFAPKSYVFRDKDGQIHIKCKGLIKERVRELEANYTSLDALIHTLQTNAIDFDRYMKTTETLNSKQTLASKRIVKNFTLSNTKREFQSDGTSIPVDLTNSEYAAGINDDKITHWSLVPHRKSKNGATLLTRFFEINQLHSHQYALDICGYDVNLTVQENYERIDSEVMHLSD